MEWVCVSTYAIGMAQGKYQHDDILKHYRGSTLRRAQERLYGMQAIFGGSPVTLWDYPSQHYGKGLSGSARYATPSYVIWNLLERYTRPGDTILDPMCGSGTTVDVAKDLGRRGRGFDLNPYRDDIRQADARSIPLNDETVDFVFIDPPCSTNLKYSDDPRCIGKLDAAENPSLRGITRCLRRVSSCLEKAPFHGCTSVMSGIRRRFQPVGARTVFLLVLSFPNR